MAEVVGLGASILAFVQVADRLIEVTKYCIEAIRDCPREIRALLVEISSLRAVLENLDFLLRSDQGLQPSLAALLSSNTGPVNKCRESLVQLENILPSGSRTVNGKRQKILTAAQYLAWPLREDRVKKLLGEISQFKATIAFALSCDAATDLKDLKKDLALVKQTLAIQEKMQIYLWLESTNPTGNHSIALQLHQEFTSQWILRSAERDMWSNTKGKFLWIHGIPGAGKTVLAAFLIEQIKLICMNYPTSRPFHDINTRMPLACVYYYCYFARNQNEAAPFLRWLVSQLCRQADLIPDGLVLLFQSSQHPSVSQLLEALERILEAFERVLVIVDAVDESQYRQDLLKVLRDLVTDQRFSKIQLLATSREYYDIESCFSDISLEVSMNNPLLEGDIKFYVHSILCSTQRFASWLRDLITEVEDALSKGAKGMFRWAVCQIDVLQRLRTQQDVRLAITHLPKSLDETYIRIFELIPEEDREFVRLALVFICGLPHLGPPISPKLLLEAIVYSLRSTHDSDHSQVLWKNSDYLKDRCGCLISFSLLNGAEYVSLAHYTVREFLDPVRVTHGTASNFTLEDYHVTKECLTLVTNVIQDDQLTAASMTTDKRFWRAGPSESLSLYCFVAAATVTETDVKDHLHPSLSGSLTQKLGAWGSFLPNREQVSFIIKIMRP